jgi:recombination protein RecR
LQYSNPLDDLIHEFSKMPGIGKRTAQRISFYLISLPKNEVSNIGKLIADIPTKISFCNNCYSFIDIHKGCSFCQDDTREKDKICIVSDQKDLLALENTNYYNGEYHILGGVISPLEGIGPENLRIKELLQRIEKNNFKEIIFALKPNVEGETTALYLKKILKPFSIKITQLAYGIPVGTELEWADQVTLNKAFEGRRDLFE